MAIVVIKLYRTKADDSGESKLVKDYRRRNIMTSESVDDLKTISKRRLLLLLELPRAIQQSRRRTQPSESSSYSRHHLGESEGTYRPSRWWVDARRRLMGHHLTMLSFFLFCKKKYLPIDDPVLYIPLLLWKKERTQFDCHWWTMSR